MTATSGLWTVVVNCAVFCRLQLCLSDEESNWRGRGARDVPQRISRLELATADQKSIQVAGGGETVGRTSRAASRVWRLRAGPTGASEAPVGSARPEPPFGPHSSFAPVRLRAATFRRRTWRHCRRRQVGRRRENKVAGRVSRWRRRRHFKLRNRSGRIHNADRPPN